MGVVAVHPLAIPDRVSESHPRDHPMGVELLHAEPGNETDFRRTRQGRSDNRRRRGFTQLTPREGARLGNSCVSPARSRRWGAVATTVHDTLLVRVGQRIDDVAQYLHRIGDRKLAVLCETRSDSPFTYTTRLSTTQATTAKGVAVLTRPKPGTSLGRLGASVVTMRFTMLVSSFGPVCQTRCNGCPVRLRLPGGPANRAFVRRQRGGAGAFGPLRHLAGHFHFAGLHPAVPLRPAARYWTHGALVLCDVGGHGEGGLSWGKRCRLGPVL